MSSLRQKNILLGVTGSIAAYKSAYIVRYLKKAGANVQVIMTDEARTFIGPVTLSTLSENPVLSQFTAKDGSGTWNNHVELGMWADLFLIAPASANTLAKMAHGIADNLLLTIYLSARCSVWVAPAMDLDMYKHTSTQSNLKKLMKQGVHVVKPGTGELASGLHGEGRMEEPETLVKHLVEHFSLKAVLQGKKFLVTAGPTYERIDPVRFVGNYSSGKMGYAIAEELADRGAEVTLISGPTALSVSHPRIRRVDVESAEEMYTASVEAFVEMDGAIMAAAVADYKPSKPTSQKLKREKGTPTLELEKTKDIAAELGKRKNNQILVAFALETENALDHAREKLERKNADAIVLNTLEIKGAGFGSDTNKIWIVDRNRTDEYPLTSKIEVARFIVDYLLKEWFKSSTEKPSLTR